MMFADDLDHAPTVDHRPRVARRLADRGDVGEAAIVWLDLAGDRTAAPRARRRAASALIGLGAAEDATSALLDLAGDPGVAAGDRRKSAVALARAGVHDRAKSCLAGLASDPATPPAERRKAAVALVGLGRPDEATEILLDLAGDGSVPADERRRAALELVKLGRGDAAVRFLRAIASRARYFAPDRVRAAADLAQVGHAGTARRILLGMAQDSKLDFFGRAQAATSYARFADHQKAAGLLASVFSDPAMPWNYGWPDNVAALIELGYADVVPRLIASPTGGDAPFEHDLYVARYLLRCGRFEDAVAKLSALAEESADYATRARAALTLLRLGRTVPARDLLTKLAADSDFESRWLWEVASAFRRLGEADAAVAALVRLANYKHAEPHQRVEAILALKAMGRFAGAMKAARKWAKRDEEISYQLMNAALAIARLGAVAEAGKILLEGIAKASYRDTRSVEMLDRLGFRDAAAAILLAWARDASASTYQRCDAAKGLAGCGGREEATAILVELVRASPRDAYLGDGLRCASVLVVIGRPKVAERELRGLVLRSGAEFLWPLKALRNVPHRTTATGLAGIARDTALRRDLRLHAALAVRQWGDVRQAHATLAELLAEPATEAWIRVRAAMVLGEAKQSRKAAIDALQVVIADARVTEPVRESAMEALQQMTPED
ncbi:hypothetical protein KOI35_26280 [Actinoplanes bogorensis]|uniref:HEAT repeat domain-containing protein n=1 Tax=Paractinoplanes bogorensis TaxID=1610840 RepID=A0ABS5YUC5_9ACTN|nr:hypothetical protein [Actinoplanes bogorensis]MBU2667025.1 hypothetical protein [Actinoplanes bogorensis]